jgi:hypothetical protein
LGIYLKNRRRKRYLQEQTGWENQKEKGIINAQSYKTNTVLWYIGSVLR